MCKMVDQYADKIKGQFSFFDRMIINGYFRPLLSEQTRIGYLYSNVKEAAEKWGLSERRIQVLCATNRIPDVMRISNVWLIPKTASKPKDGRFKKRDKEESDNE